MRKIIIHFILFSCLFLSNKVYSQCPFAAPFFQSGTYSTNGYYAYPDYNFSSNLSTITMNWFCSDIPNRFTLYSPSGAQVTSGWVGFVNWAGPWGPSLNTPNTGTLTLTDITPLCGCWKVRVETVVNTALPPFLGDYFDFSIAESGAPVVPGVIVLWTNSATICQGQSGTVSANVTPSGGTFSWSPGGGVGQSMTASPATTTTYTVTYTTFGGCTKTETATITVNPAPTLSVNSPTVCLGNPVTLTAVPSIGGGTYSWTPLAGNSSSVTISPISTFSYTVTYTAPNGCSATASGTVTVVPSPTVAVNSATICSGASTTLNATVPTIGGTYSWSPGGGNTPSIVVSPVSTTTYTVTYTAINGCTKTATGTVIVNPTPTLTVNSETVCLGNPVTLTAVPSIGGGTYSWTPLVGSSSSVTVSPIANFTFTVTYTAPGGCTATATGSVTVIPSPTVSVSSTSICSGQSGALTAIVSPPGGTYLWSPGGAAGQTMTDSPGSTTTYTVTYTSPNGCTRTGAGTITVKPLPVVTVSSATLCNGVSATLNTTVSIPGGVFSWNPGGGNADFLTANPTSTTTYTVTYTAPNGCSTTGTGTITVSNVTVSATSATACNGGSATITATPSPGGGTYLWTPGGSIGPSVTASPGVTTSYTVTYTAPDGCTASAVATITVAPAPTIIVNPASICTGQSATISANTIPSGGTYSWSHGGGFNSNMTASPLITTTYTVSYTAPNGCTNTGTGTITVNPTPAITVNSPTICLGQSASLTANGGTTYFWSSGGISNIEVVTPIATTTYTVTGITTGCSGTALSTVTVQANLTGTISQNICAGNAYVFNGQSQTTSGAYLDTLVSFHGCDSIITLNLTVNPALTGSFNQTVCTGNSYFFNGQTLTSTGAYKDTVSTLLGCDSIVTLNLTIAPPLTGSFNQTICTGNSYFFNGQTLTTSGAYKDTVSTIAGCDSIVTLNLTIALPLTGSFNQTVCAGNSYFFNGQTLTTSGAYKDTVSTFLGCDSIITLNLAITPALTGSFSQAVCTGNSYFFNGQTLTNSGAYKDTVSTIAGCDSIVTLNLTVNTLTGNLNQTICTGNSYVFNGQTLTTSGISKDTLTTTSGCDSIVTLNLTVTPALTGSFNQTICTGNSYVFNGQTLTTTGAYKDTLSTIAGCDSIVTLNLTVNTITSSLNQTICTGNSYVFNGQTLTTSGVSKDTLTTTSGCDSIVTLNLTVTPALTGSFNQTICTGNSYVFNGQTLTTTGAYKDTISTIAGCDSIVTLNLTVNTITGSLNQTICTGNSYVFNGQTLTTSGISKDTLTTTSGCDSIITLNLTVTPALIGSLNQTICTGNSYVFNGQTLTTSGISKDTLTTTSGCDSIVTLNLTVTPVLTGSFNQTICTGNSYVFNGQTLTTSGVYKDTLSTSSGCDTIVTLNLTVTPALTGSFNQIICTGNSYFFNGQTLTASGVYKDTLSTPSGCDTIVTLNLTVNPALTGNFNQTVCSNNPYFFNGQNLINSGVYKDTVTTSSGCDSIVTLNLTVNAIDSTILNQTICSGNTYFFNGQNLGASGVYLDTLATSLGCDSTITLNLTVNPNASGTINQSICSGNSYFFNGQNLTTTGQYLDTLISALACDSVVTLNLTVSNIVTGTIAQTICTGNSYFFNGQNIINAGQYLDTLIAFFGCDSVLTLNLTVNPPLTGSFSQNICTGNSYFFNGQNISVSGNYLDTVSTSSGCDSIVTLNLVVAPILTGNFNQTICKGNSFFFNGQNLTNTGTYFDTLITTSGCDSIATLNLTVNTLTGSFNQTICKGNSYLFNGQNITTTGSYLDTLTTTSGCDSIVTLNLTVNTLTGSFNHVVCVGSSYFFNGQVLTNTGTYLDTLTTTSGCDSMVILNLTVSQNVTGTINQIICLGSTYYFNGQTITTSGSYKDTLTSAFGCDSIVTLNLSFAPSVTGTITQTICTGSSYYFNGQNLSSTGSYLDTLSSVSGCDSILTLILIATPPQSGTINQTICNGSFYVFNGQNLTNTGVYLDTLTAVSGCDSVLSLVLVVTPSPITGISSDITINLGESTTLMVSGNGVYNWSPSTGLNSTTGSVVSASPTVTTTYCVIIVSSNNCIDTACITVTVEDNCPVSDSLLTAPNAFSPNNDGINDEYCLQGWDQCVKEFSFGIYDRWGEEVFKSETPNFCWDGKFKGKPLDAQVLVYYIKARYSNMEDQVLRKGNISLLK